MSYQYHEEGRYYGSNSEDGNSDDDNGEGSDSCSTLDEGAQYNASQTGHTHQPSHLPGGEYIQNEQYALYDKLDAIAASGLPNKHAIPSASSLANQKRYNHLWDTRFAELTEFYEQHGHTSVPVGYELNPALSRWVTSNRKNYRQNKLSEERIQRLSALGFHFEPYFAARSSNDEDPTKNDKKMTPSELWDKNYQKLVEWHEQHGTCNVSRPVDEPLFKWTLRQRLLYQNGKLTDERYERLSLLEFDFEKRKDCSHKGISFYQHWENRFEELKEYVEQHGTCNVKKDYPGGLAFWVATQKTKIKQKKLSEDRCKRLAELGVHASKEVDPKSAWDARFQELVEHKKKYNTTFVSAGKRSLNPSLASWVLLQKIHRRDGKLSEDHIHRLEELGFDFTLGKRGIRRRTKTADKIDNGNDGSVGGESRPHDDKCESNLPKCYDDEQWDNRFKELVAFQQQYSHCNVNRSFELNSALGSWVVYQKQLKRDNKLANDRIERLEAIGFDFSFSKDSAWTKKFEELKKFKAKHGHFKVTKNNADPSLKHWTRDQRRYYRINKLAKDRVEKLEGIGFDFDSIKDMGWDEKFEQLKQFKNKTGHFNVTKEEVGPTLPPWIFHQRKFYRENKLPKDRIEKLESIGFDFDSILDMGWAEKFEQLKEFKNKTGHFNVTSKEVGPTLLRWILHQRKLYRMNKLPKDRLEKLEGIGFNFNYVQETSWGEKFEELKQFKMDNGHLNLTIQDADPSLIHWVKSQRRAYKDKNLAKDRVEKLEAIGFHFSRVSSSSDDLFDVRISVDSDKTSALNSDESSELEVYKNPSTRSDKLWDLYYHLILQCAERSCENTSVPGRPLIISNAVLRTWLDTQRDLQRKGSLSDDRAKRISKLRDVDLEGSKLERETREVMNILESGEETENLDSSDKVEAHSSFHEDRTSDVSEVEDDAELASRHSCNEQPPSEQETLAPCKPVEVVSGKNTEKTQGPSGNKNHPSKPKKSNGVGLAAHLMELWDYRFNELVAFKNEFGHCNVRRGRIKGQKSMNALGNWVRQQRKRHKLKKLPDERFQRLVDLGFSFEPTETATVFGKSIGIKNNEHDTSSSQKTPSNDNLIVTHVTEELSAGPRSRGSFKKSKEIVGMSQNELWNHRFQQLVDYRTENGDCNISIRSKSNPSLAKWVSMQRWLARKNKLSSDRIDQLDSIGFEWNRGKVNQVENPGTDNWELRYKELLQFLQENGHTRVPNKYPQNTSLGTWVYSQRKKFRTNSICSERLQKLIEIGFDFSGKECRRERTELPKASKLDTNTHFQKHWEKRFRELIQFKEQNGTFSVPIEYSGPLSSWVHLQRRTYRKGTMPEERRVKLVQVGFDLDSSKGS